MRYIISDIHGCREEYFKLLDKINFSEEDQLYVLGDVVDRGINPIGVLQDLMKRKNVIYILGNHDFLFHYFIRTLGFDLCDFRNEEDKWDFRSWLKDGGLSTVEEFLDLEVEEKRKIFEFIDNASMYEIVEYGEKRYVLVHAGISGFDETKSLDEYQYTDFISERMDYAKRYYQDRNVFIVTGHTPTPLIRADKKPEVFVGNGNIAIDCGCVFGGQLAAYCIETGEVKYVEKTGKYPN